MDARADCAIFTSLPRIARCVALVGSGELSAYAAAIREDVCVMCPYERLDGSCSRRDNATCPLDRRMELIVSTIEEVMRAEPSGPSRRAGAV